MDKLYGISHVMYYIYVIIIYNLSVIISEALPSNIDQIWLIRQCDD